MFLRKPTKDSVADPAINRRAEASQPAWDREPIEVEEVALEYPLSQPVAAHGELHIGPGVALSGDIRNCSRLVISGSLTGTLIATDVLVESTASVHAVIIAQRVDLCGNVAGHIIAAESIHFRDSARFEGRALYDRMFVEAGAALTGELSRSPTADEQRALAELDPAAELGSEDADLTSLAWPISSSG